MKLEERRAAKLATREELSRIVEATRNPFEALLRYQAAPVGDGGIAKADRTRALLRTKGALTAAEICEHVRFPNSGLVYAALKHDIAAGRVVFDGVRGGRYRWAADGVQSAHELLDGRNSQHVLKAEGESPDATDRENCVNASPDGGPMGVGQAAAAAPAGAKGRESDTLRPTDADSP